MPGKTSLKIQVLYNAVVNIINARGKERFSTLNVHAAENEKYHEHRQYYGKASPLG